jgi:choline kinase
MYSSRAKQKQGTDLRGVVLLAAGQGERLRPLTETTPKSLLPLAGRSALARAIDAALRHGIEDIIVVTGFQQDRIEDLVAGEYAGCVRTIHNPLFREDVNIYSVELGVNALLRPEKGYLIVETDLVLERAAWDMIYEAAWAEESFWVTRGRYSSTLTGGIVKAVAGNTISGIAYAPEYDPRYEGWLKMVGILGVGPGQVSTDRACRRRGLERTKKQYYLQSWVEGIADLSCKALDLGDLLFITYNSEKDYRVADALLSRRSELL